MNDLIKGIYLVMPYMLKGYKVGLYDEEVQFFKYYGKFKFKIRFAAKIRGPLKAYEII